MKKLLNFTWNLNTIKNCTSKKKKNCTSSHLMEKIIPWVNDCVENQAQMDAKPDTNHSEAI